MSDHISVEELADAAEQLLLPSRADAVRSHLVACATCRGTADELARVTPLLASEPAPSMPPEVIARLDAVIAEERARRVAASRDRAISPADSISGTDTTPGAAATSSADGAAGPDGAQILAWQPRPRLPAEYDHKHHRRRAAGWILAAAGVAALVGFGGYVISARAGLNEPPSSLAAVSSSDLGAQADALEQSGDIDPHRFSRAWFCARQVTDDRITGIAAVTVDGTPALLVYLQAGSLQKVAVVERCDEGTPHVTATSHLGR